MVNKKGWLRILEAGIAILIIAGVLLAMHSRTSQREDISSYVYEIQMRVLSEISNDADLRKAVLKKDEDFVERYARENIPEEFEIDLKICELGAEDNCWLTQEVTKDVYVEEIIIAANLDIYAPKKVRLFVWVA